jgi:hypothetical protein
MPKRNETLFFKNGNETERIFFWNRNPKPKRNEFFSETTRNEMKKNMFLTPVSNSAVAL